MPPKILQHYIVTNSTECVNKLFFFERIIFKPDEIEFQNNVKETYPPKKKQVK